MFHVTLSLAILQLICLHACWTMEQVPSASPTGIPDRAISPHVLLAPPATTPPLLAPRRAPRAHLGRSRRHQTPPLVQHVPQAATRLPSARPRCAAHASRAATPPPTRQRASPVLPAATRSEGRGNALHAPQAATLLRPALFLVSAFLSQAPRFCCYCFASCDGLEDAALESLVIFLRIQELFP